MKEDIVVKNGIIIPAHELEITASRSGGAGGQHVNKTSTRITLRWNIPRTQALDEQQKQRVLIKLQSELTTEGDLIIHSSTYRSQQQNKKSAFDILAQKIRNALHVPKKRMKSKLPQQAKEARLEKKKKHSEVKKMRRKVEY
ncbi:MAG TPA: alternative ribosome rescue aminoacyl-tRNA hydrolase ArfB [Candidatus Dependentiae bacterium]|nr:alternative ribosome rescue aminoacyl-tRNA hydrolase ArfB [Candidatus Dependentiae bacterium]HRQ62886.1 alternative ribosome rescue aminoacyl-tRNA hydrolase ArfB [Candidatus Dependentiae bacterium]